MLVCYCHKSEVVPYLIYELWTQGWCRSFASQPACGVVINAAVGCHCFPPGQQLPAQSKTTTVPRPVTNYTAWWQRHWVWYQLKYYWVVFTVSRFIILVFSVRWIHRMNHGAIAMMFIRPSVCLGQACIVIIPCTVVQIWVYGWIVQCYGHPYTKACPPIPNYLFSVPFGRELPYGCAN